MTRVRAEQLLGEVERRARQARRVAEPRPREWEERSGLRTGDRERARGREGRGEEDTPSRGRARPPSTPSRRRPRRARSSPATAIASASDRAVGTMRNGRSRNRSARAAANPAVVAPAIGCMPTMRAVSGAVSANAATAAFSDPTSSSTADAGDVRTVTPASSRWTRAVSRRSRRPPGADPPSARRSRCRPRAPRHASARRYRSRVTWWRDLSASASEPPMRPRPATPTFKPAPRAGTPRPTARRDRARRDRRAPRSSRT